MDVLYGMMVKSRRKYRTHTHTQARHITNDPLLEKGKYSKRSISVKQNSRKKSTQAEQESRHGGTAGAQMDVCTTAKTRHSQHGDYAVRHRWRLSGGVR